MVKYKFSFEKKFLVQLKSLGLIEYINIDSFFTIKFTKLSYINNSESWLNHIT